MGNFASPESAMNQDSNIKPAKGWSGRGRNFDAPSALVVGDYFTFPDQYTGKFAPQEQTFANSSKPVLFFLAEVRNVGNRDPESNEGKRWYPSSFFKRRTQCDNNGFSTGRTFATTGNVVDWIRKNKLYDYAVLMEKLKGKSIIISNITYIKVPNFNTGFPTSTSFFEVNFCDENGNTENVDAEGNVIKSVEEAPIE